MKIGESCAVIGTGTIGGFIVRLLHLANQVIIKPHNRGADLAFEAVGSSSNRWRSHVYCRYDRHCGTTG